MKTVADLLFIILLCGCTTKTEYGSCIGIADEKDPHLVYKVSAWNVFLGILFVESIVPPIIVLSDATMCPVAKKY
jgi:hypothetical protein